MSGTNLKFGIFNAPFQGLESNPANTLEHNLNLIEQLDQLNYSEIWLDDAQSCKTETSANREAFISTAVARTQHITIGTRITGNNTGLLSTNMHQLNQISEGRAAFLINLDVPVGNQNDSYISTQSHDVHALVQELKGLAHNKVMLASGLSPASASVAGTCGLGLLSLDATSAGGFNALPSHWEIYTRYAKANNQHIDRSAWSLVGPMHIARTRKQALSDVREGLAHWLQSFQHKYGFSIVPQNSTDPAQALIDSGLAVIGTPRDAINQIKRLYQATGGFGTFLQIAHNWADADKTLKSYELFAQAVAPKFHSN